MMSIPKGYDYWVEEPGNVRIREDAPDWAKQEFKDYMQSMEDEANGNM